MNSLSNFCKSRLWLWCLTLPAIVAPLLLLGSMARATEIPSSAAPTILNLSIVKQSPVSGQVRQIEIIPMAEHPMLEFTEEESSTAIALFGCDCPAHLNTLREMRGLPLLQ
jgi:hypothetical protein